MDKENVNSFKSWKSKRFQYVLDGFTLILADGTDLTADVKKI
jgi:outer membrane protein